MSNTLLNLGLRDQRNVVDRARYVNTQITQLRAYFVAAVGGIERVESGSRIWDPSNIAGPNLNPFHFIGGAIGLAGGGFGVKFHEIPTSN